MQAFRPAVTAVHIDHDYRDHEDAMGTKPHEEGSITTKHAKRIDSARNSRNSRKRDA